MNIRLPNLSEIKNSTLCTMIMITVWHFVLFTMKDKCSEQIFIRICVLSSLVIFLFEIWMIIKKSGLLICPSILFLMSFYLFQNGQFLLLSLNIEFDKFYLNTLDYLLNDAVLYSSSCNLFAGLAGLVMARHKNSNKSTIYKADSYRREDVANAGLLGLTFTGLIAIPLLMIKFFGFALSGGYYAVREFEEHIPAIFGLIEYMFVPFCILYLVYTKNTILKRMVMACAVLWFLLTALCGDRTTGVSGLMSLFLVEYMSAVDKTKLKKKTIKLAAGGILCIVLINVVSIFRTSGNIQDVIQSISLDNNSILVNVLSELGFNSFSIMTMMYVVPSYEPFQLGLQYLTSAIAGFFPSTLDFTGLIARLTYRYNIFNRWITQYFSQYNFGLGFSLNAESYINFGWFGMFAIFFECLIIFYNLPSYFGQMRDGHRYEVYKTLTLLFVWFTLPRRNSYYIWNALFWCVFIMKIYLSLLCRRNKEK